MLPFTKQERLVIAFVCVVLMAGMGLRYLCSRFAFINNFVNLIAEGKLHPRVDINHASGEELVTVPYIGEKTAAAIIAYRAQNGPFKDIDEVRSVKGLRGDTFVKIRKYLFIRD